MEINVTEFVTNEDPYDYQASRAESGLDNIGQITWQRPFVNIAWNYRRMSQFTK
jgi:hypothetical protein